MTGQSALFKRLSADDKQHRQLLRELERLAQSRRKGEAALVSSLNHALCIGDAGAVAALSKELAEFRTAADSAALVSREIQTALTAPTLSPAVPAETAPVPAEGVASQDPAGVHGYCISASTLAEAHTFLTQHLPGVNREPEWMLAVTGVKVGAMHTLERLIEVKLASQSFGQASFDMQDFTRIAVMLHDYGQALHCIFHTHRFPGPPHPSATDIRLQRILEEGGYPAIQAVFSEDGYVRFFADQRPFSVQVYGKGVRSVNGSSTLYRIVQCGALPYPTAAATASRRGAGVRPLPAPAGR